MPRKKTSCLTAAFPVIVVACVSLVIVGSIVTWMAAREGTNPVELVSEMLRGQQSARPVLAQVTPFSTATPYPSPTPTSTFTPSATPEPVETISDATATPRPTEQPTATHIPPSPTPTILPTLTATAAPAPQIEPAIESPIRSGSALPERPATRLVIPAMGIGWDTWREQPVPATQATWCWLDT
jgi:hypothetical protein